MNKHSPERFRKHAEIQRMDGNAYLATILEDAAEVAEAVEAFVHIGWAKHNGAGEIIFRQAGHPENDKNLAAMHWSPVYYRNLLTVSDD